MPPKSAANAPPAPRQDLPWALAILSNPEADPIQLPQALTFLAGLAQPQLPSEVEDIVHLLTLAMPFTCANDASVASAAIRFITRLCTELREYMQEALRQTASVQAFWSVPAYFHASFDAYVSRLAAITAEAQEPPPAAASSPQKKPDSRAASKGPPPPPVDPESTLPGPSKFALEVSMTALGAALGPPFGGESSAAAEAAVVDVVGRDVSPLLTLLKHHSPRIQVLSLRLIRQLMRCEPLAHSLAAAGATPRLCQLLTASMHGAVREEVLATLSRVMAAHAPCMQEALDAGLPLVLLKQILAPTTGVPQEPQADKPQTDKPPERQPSPRSAATSSAPRASTAGDKRPSSSRPTTPEAPPGPPQFDFVKPVASSPDKLVELSVQLLQQLATHHHGVVRELLRLGGLQLLLALLPAPVLPELPPPPARKRVSSASDTFFAHMMGRGRPSQSGAPGTAPGTAPKPRDAWQPFLDGAPTLPLPATRLASHSLQASLLATLACLLAEPGVADWMWHVHPTRRQHLQILHMLSTEQPPKSDPPPPPPSTGPSRRGSVAAPVVVEAPPDPTKPPFPPEVRAAALTCILQLTKHPRWLELAPYLTALQTAIHDRDMWDARMVAPLAEILQKIMQKRLPPPPRAAAMVAAAAAAAAGGGGGGALRSSAASDTGSTASGGGGGGGGGALPLHSQHVQQLSAPSAAQLRDCEGTASPAGNGLPAEANGLAEAELSSEDAVEALKELAKLARKMADPSAASVVAAALLVLPDAAILAPPWPPLPSPPPTPPPPPLPTSQYLWDALGRPVMTDGIKLVHL